MIKQIGNYYLTQLLGRGGFAAVYLGNHVHLNTQAAVKILDTRLVGTEAEGFRNEARLVAALDHPNIVKVLDFGIVDESAFLVMNYAPHGSLRQRHPKGTRLALMQVTSYVKQIAQALQYAHNQHVIHRDIKPDNLLVGTNDEVLLSDFGIAVMIQNSHSQKGLGAAGTVIYMAPEQIQGKPRPASDQYALGIVVYEWLCGVPPFKGSLAEVLGQHIRATPPSLCLKVPELPSAVEAVVMRALTKDYRTRFASVQDFADALEDASLSLPATPVQPSSAPSQSLVSRQRRLSKRTVVLGLLGCVGIAGIGGGGIWLALTHLHSSGTAPLVPVGTTVYTYRGHIGPVIEVAWSPDGRRIASRSQDKTVQVWHAFSGGNVVAHHTNYNVSPINGIADPPINSISWSPDRQRIISVDIDEQNPNSGAEIVQIWDSLTGQDILTYPAVPGGMAWSPDGRFIASVGIIITAVQGPITEHAITVKVWDAMTGQDVLAYQNDALIIPYIGEVVWSPHGASIAFLYNATNSTGVVLWNTAKNQTIDIYRDESINHTLALAWSPDGQRIAITSGKDVQVWNTSTASQQSTYRNHSHLVSAITWSPDGRYIASASDDETVQIWHAATCERVFTYHGHVQAVKAVSWSPDGKYIASAGADSTVKVWQAL